MFNRNNYFGMAENTDEKSFLTKWGLLALLVVMGSGIQVLISNQKKQLNWKENTAIFLSGCLCGGCWAYYFYDNRNYLIASGFVSLVGYHIVNALVLIAKDPKIIKEIIKDKIAKL